jgi:hypothetical protein
MIAKHKYLFLFILSCMTSIVVLSVWYSEKLSRYEGEIILQTKIVDSLNNENLLYRELSSVDNHFISGNYEVANSEYQQMLRDLDSLHVFYDPVQMRLKRIQSFDEIRNKNIDSQDLEVLQLAMRKRDEFIRVLNYTLDSMRIKYETETKALLYQLQAKNSELEEKLIQPNQKEKIQVISFKNPKGKLIHYLGEVIDGKADGGGVGIWNTGSIYKGEWKDNKRNGQGRYEWADGDVYEGSYVNDVRQGEGIYTWLSGERYSGEWSNDKRNGFGKLYDKDNNVKYEGQWLNDKIVE